MRAAASSRLSSFLRRRSSFARGDADRGDPVPEPPRGLLPREPRGDSGGDLRPNAPVRGLYSSSPSSCALTFSVALSACSSFFMSAAKPKPKPKPPPPLLLLLPRGRVPLPSAAAAAVVGGVSSTRPSAGLLLLLLLLLPLLSAAAAVAPPGVALTAAAAAAWYGLALACVPLSD